MAHCHLPSLPPLSVDDGAAPHPVPVLPVPLPLHRHDRLRLHDRGHRARALHRSPLPHQLQPGHQQVSIPYYTMYRVSHLVANLGWVELNLGSSLGWLAIQWVATAQAGWWNITNPCQQNPVRDQMGHPVYWNGNSLVELFVLVV